MKANVLDTQKSSDKTVLDSQNAVLLSGYVPDIRRLASIIAENRIVKVRKGDMARILAEFSHSQGSTLDYGFTWLGLAQGESIISSNWQPLSDGVILSNPYNANGTTTVMVSGLVLGLVYRLVNTITTNQGRADSRTIIISCNRR